MTRRPIESRISPTRTAEDHGEDALRDAYAAWATGVAVMTARDDDGRVYGMTVAAFTPLSVDPPLVIACIHNDAPLASLLEAGVACAISILNAGQKRAATTFADRFAVPGGLLTDEPLPVVADSAANLLGRVAAVHDGGDHRIVVVRVETVRTGPGDQPLLYWQRAYRQLDAHD